MGHRILIVDDEPDILEILRFNLEVEGYEVFTAENAADGQSIINQHIQNEKIDLILLDVMMTPKSGFEWAKELKTSPQTALIPIVFCTAKTTENDLLTGFGIGSDDYICKPFRISEVKARIKAILRRSSSIHNEVAHSKDISYKGIKMHLDSKVCTIDGKEIAFTKLEFELLALLLSKPGQVFSREAIIKTVWPNDTIVLDRTVDVNITRIRKKIGQYGDYLRTRFGYGYLFEA